MLEKGIHYGKSLREMIRLVKRQRSRMKKRIRLVKNTWTVLKKFVTEYLRQRFGIQIGRRKTAEK